MIWKLVSLFEESPVAWDVTARVLSVFNEELQVDLEDGLEEAHVCALVQADLMLPNVDNQNLTGGQSEEGTLALKVLVFAALAAVGSLNVHDEDVLGHPLGPAV